jgi:prepilin-type N-terminal cleavage/methylation domain-containing protein
LRGFTLTELAVVLVIVALLIGGMLIPLAAQDDLRRTQETLKTLNDVRDALLGFAATNGRLPCPAAPAATGVESPVGGGSCTNPHDGFVPGITLGLAPINNQGYIIDGWGNPIRFAVSRDPTSGTMSSNAAGPWRDSFTTTPTATTGVSGIGMANLHPDIHVCNGGAASASIQCAGTSLTTGAVAVLYSLAKNVANGGGGIDESQNPNQNSAVAVDRLFVSHEPAPASATNGEFDDLVIWLSPSILFNRMIAAGRLP